MTPTPTTASNGHGIVSPEVGGISPGTAGSAVSTGVTGVSSPPMSSQPPAKANARAAIRITAKNRLRISGLDQAAW